MIRSAPDPEEATAVQQQRTIWGQRCPSLLAQRDELKAAVLACIGDAEGQEAVRDRKMLELTKGQVQLLAAALRHAVEVYPA